MAEECQAGKERLLDEQEIVFSNIRIVIQFGFVSLFAATFPIAPFLALLNNIIQVTNGIPELFTLQI